MLSRTSGRSCALLCTALLLGCGPRADVPAAQRGFFDSIAALLSGSDRRQSEALEAEAVRREAEAARLAVLAASARREAAGSEGEALAAQRLVQGPRAASRLLQETTEELDRMEAVGRQRLNALQQARRAGEPGVVPQQGTGAAMRDARGELDTMELASARAKGIALRLAEAPAGAYGGRASLQALRESGTRLDATADELTRSLAAPQ